MYNTNNEDAEYEYCYWMDRCFEIQKEIEETEELRKKIKKMQKEQKAKIGINKKQNNHKISIEISNPNHPPQIPTTKIKKC